jgi:hypothetical protein
VRHSRAEKTWPWGREEYKGMKKALEDIHNGGKSYEKPDQAAIDWALESPKNAAKFRDKFGFFPEAPKAYQ